MGQLYARTKIFHYPEKLASLPADVPQVLPPLHIRIKPTNVCNHRCGYCAYRAEGLQLGEDMGARDALSREKFFEICDDLVAMGVKAVTFSGGGEPLLHPDLTEAAGRLHAGGVSLACLTNGSRLSGRVAEFLAQAAVWVRVSIDGWDGPSYARFRGVSEGEFGKVLGNMAAFKALGGPCHLGVSLIIGRDNAGHVFELAARLKDAGADSVKLSPCVVSNRGSENRDYHAPVFAAVRDQVRAVQESLAGDGFAVYDAYHELEDKFDKDYSWCPYLQILPVIGADAKVYSCQDKAYSEAGTLGSLEDVRFRDFWFADKSRFFRIDPSRDCRHHCVANEKNRLVHSFLNLDRRHLPFV